MSEKPVIDVKDFSFEKYIWHLLTLAKQHKVPIDIFGQEVSEYTGMVYPLYRMIVNGDEKDTICIIGGVHGNEVAGPFSILELMENFYQQLPQHFRYIIYPLINPTGFDLRRRYDDDGSDLNAIYEDTLKSKKYRESQAFYEDVKKFAPFEAVLALHEDPDVEKFYIYGLGKNNLDFYRAICAFGKLLCPAWVNADIYGESSDDFGLILSTARDHAFDGVLFHEGLAKIALTFETPGLLDAHFRSTMMAHLVLDSLHLLDAMRCFPPRRSQG